MIETRIYSEKKDYPTLAAWWREHDCHVPDASQLDTLGIIVSVDGEDVAYICAYLSVGVGVAHLDHLVTNPYYNNPIAKLRAIKKLMREMFYELKKMDYQLIKAVTWSKTLSRICQREFKFLRVGGEYENLSLII